MDIIFVGVACTEAILKKTEKKFYNGVSQVRPQQSFDFKLVKALSKTQKVQALTIPPVGAFPKTKCILYKGEREQINENLNIKYISLLNFPVIKNIIIMIYLSIYLILMLKRNKQATIFCGYVSLEVILPALLISKIMKRKSVLMVPDLPEFSISYSNKVNGMKNNIYKLINTFERLIYNNFDGYILFSKHMNERINLKNRPYIVIEGIIDIDDELLNSSSEKSEEISTDFIMYGGTLHKKFGINKLIEAYLLADLINTELWIFGQGDYEDEIKLIATKNKKIKFKGSVDKLSILKYEKQAVLLVNPRPSKEILTKYSFPSKTLEYMLSGTPVLTTKLLGIPEEYDPYLYYFQKEDEESMSKTLKDILLLPLDERKRRGQLSQKYVVENKNSDIQACKIIVFIQSINS